MTPPSPDSFRRDGSEFLDLSHAVLFSPPDATPREVRAVAMLADEIRKRTRLRLPVRSEWPEAESPVLAVGRHTRLAAGPARAFLSQEAPPAAEGFQVHTVFIHGRPVLTVAGTDERGVLFGAGYLLRHLRLERDRLLAPATLAVSTAPRVPLRGHQLGYRPKTNSYDGWDVPQWEQYLRDLAVFGANAVELIPPRSDDDPDSPHFPLPPLEMMVEMSRLADEYGLDVWTWYPALDSDYTNPEQVAFALREWGEVFRALPRLDAVFVPGGDPGHTPPAALFALLEHQAASLRRCHPQAGMWVSPQGFTAAWLEEFFQLLQPEPEWLAGVVHGPQVGLPLPEFRERVPARYPVRDYPDITHTFRCQFPVPDWDLAYALTLHREPVNPRPRAMQRIFQANLPHTLGFLTYSEGCNDDVNKALWSGLGWNPEADPVEILREYSRYFIGAEHAEGFAQGLLALERNWHGPLLTNEAVYTTLRQFQALEANASPALRGNWRFQQALYRAYYDAFTRARLLHETAAEERALDALRAAPQLDAETAMTRAETLLTEAAAAPPAPEWRARVFELAEALFQSIRMQLSVPRYQAIAVNRGANLDLIDTPLNNRIWLRQRFQEIRSRKTEAERLQELAALTAWTNPGPGGFYDELGNPSQRPHLVPGPGAEQDPAFWQSALTGFAIPVQGRLSQARHAETLHQHPLQLRYTGLDAGTAYHVRIIYGGETTRGRVRLEAGEGLEIHPWIPKPPPGEAVTFPIPSTALTPTGTLLLTWRREPGLGGNGRGCQVAEVWLMAGKGPG